MSLFGSQSGLLARLWKCSLLLSLLLLGGASAQLNNDTSPTSQFKSRPDLHAPILDFALLRPELVTPGYIMLAPYRNLDPGPYIYDNWGNLVWSGVGVRGPQNAHTPHVCQYKGEDHLCFFEGEQYQGFARGHGVIMDKHYRTVATVESSGAGASSDMHEFRMTPYSNGTTALLTVFQPRQYDLTTNPRFNVVNGMGWIVEGVFQEVEIGTGKVLFEWRSLDHVDPGLSWTMPGTTDTSGDGLREQSPWDYFHLNSVDKNEEGDYLISSRHLGAIYKLSGEDGSIIWQLGGANPSFEQTNFVFSYQHHARWLSDNSTHTVLSFLDNASNTQNSTGRFSHGWIVSIDHASKKATKIKEWGAPEPEGGLSTGSQGSLQLFENGGCHIGWGEHASFSEHTADGTAVMYGKLATRPSNVMIYRSNKYNWTAFPLTKPALYTYSKDGESSMVFYVSWNGATEVRSWAFYTADSPSGPFTLVERKRKMSFETNLHSPNVRPWAYATALDKDGRPLGDSVVARTFVPSLSLRKHCGDEGCGPSESVSEDDRTPYDADVHVDEEYLSPHRGYDTSGYYHTSNSSAPDDLPALPPTKDADADDDTPAAPIPTAITPPASVEDTHPDGTADGTAQPGSNSGSYVGASLFLFVVGTVIGILLHFFASFLWRNGALRRLEPWTERLTHLGGGGGSGGGGGASFSSRVLGRYQRVREKEFSDGFEFGERGSSGSGGLRRRSSSSGGDVAMS